MARHELTDEQWKKIKELLPGKKKDPGCTAKNNRRFVNGVLWIARTGAHWRELPKEFGKWNTVFQRYNRWGQTGVWEKMFKAMAQDPDFEYLMIDSTIVRAHQHSSGAKGGIQKRKPWVDQRAD